MGKMAKDTAHINWGEHFYYDETSPSGLRRKKVWTLPKYGKEHYEREGVGTVAGNLTQKGYWAVMCEGEVYKCHRIVYELMVSRLGELFIDHIDGNRSNNAISNLRAVTHVTNARNKRMGRNNTSGVQGVSKRKDTHWVATWNDEASKQHSAAFNINKLGEEAAFEAALARRLSEVAKLSGYTERHGNGN